jgi:hypothetical protein
MLESDRFKLKMEMVKQYKTLCPEIKSASILVWQALITPTKLHQKHLLCLLTKTAPVSGGRQLIETFNCPI